MRLKWGVGVVVGVMLVVGAASMAAAPSPSRTEGCPVKAVPSVYGPVPVECVPNLEVDGDPVYGAFYPLERRIRLRAGLPRDFTLGVVEHEACHVALSDADIEPPPPIAEKICDAMASQRMGRR